MGFFFLNPIWISYFHVIILCSIIFVFLADHLSSLSLIFNYNAISGSTRCSPGGARGSVKVAQSCPSVWDPMDCRVHGILKARILECVAFPFSRGSSQSRDWTQVSHIAGGFFTSWATREARRLRGRWFPNCQNDPPTHYHM